MTTVLFWLINNSLSLLVLIPLVVLVCRISRNHPPLQNALWVVVFVKMVTPPIFILQLDQWKLNASSLAGLDQSLATREFISNRASHESSRQTEPSVMHSIDAQVRQSQELTNSDIKRDFQPLQSNSKEPLAVCLSRLLSWLPSTLLVVWLIGCSWITVRQVRLALRQRYILHEGSPPSPKLVQLMHELAKKLAIKPVRTVVLKELPSPILCCLGKPCLAWPERLNGERARGALAHELAHLKRYDHWIVWLESIATLIWWWNPLFWFAKKQLRETAEMSCDAIAIELIGDRAEYAQLLLQLSIRTVDREWRTNLGVNPNVPSSFERRFKMILNQGVSSRLSPGSLGLALSFLMLSLPTLSFVTSAQELPTPVQDNPTSTSKLSPTINPAPAMASDANNTHSDLATVVGTVRDKDARTAVNARVRLYFYQSVVKDSILRAGALTSPTLLAEVNSTDGKFRFEKVSLPATQNPNGNQELILIVTANGYASKQIELGSHQLKNEFLIELTKTTANLSGVITDATGQPVSNATIIAYRPFREPISDFRISITDSKGRYKIADLEPWESSPKLENGGETWYAKSPRFFYVQHPDFPLTQVLYDSVPNEVNVKLELAATVSGQVVDTITKCGVANVVVSAQSCRTQQWYRTITDANGNYELKLTRDYYNIWADAEDRIPIAISALKVSSGRSYPNLEIRLVRGGFVTGRVLDLDGNPTSSQTIKDGGSHSILVGHYGPARPGTGRDTTYTSVKPDGSFRLRVAPGKNFIFASSGDNFSWVNIADGEEVKADLILSGTGTVRQSALSDDFLFRSRLEQQRSQELFDLETSKLSQQEK